METIIVISSFFLIALVLLQSGKAASASIIETTGDSELFSNRKERGSELFITRVTFICGMIYFIFSLIVSFM